jgi:hypothetical protein
LRNEVEVVEQRKEIVELTNPLRRAVLHPEEPNVSEIIKRIFPESRQFPLSVKKGKHFDVSDGIVGHLARECGENVHTFPIEAWKGKTGFPAPANVPLTVVPGRTSSDFPPISQAATC